jgi:ATP synthase protein I
MSNKKYEEIDREIDHLKEEKKESTSLVGSGSTAFNIAVELVSGVIVGVIIGLFFDNLFDSKPAFLIICLILGIVATFRSIWNKYIKNNGV